MAMSSKRLDPKPSTSRLKGNAAGPVAPRTIAETEPVLGGRRIKKLTFSNVISNVVAPVGKASPLTEK
jgi:hypothetical protein